MGVDLHVQRATISANIPADDAFNRWVEAVLEDKPCQYVLTVRVVDEAEARQYNREYRDKDYATNILSFPAVLPEGLPAEIRQSELGDLLICAPVVTREAVMQARSVNDHWAHLTIHGVLHLLGYDHEETEEAAAMELLEIEILAKLGISDPYLDRA